MPNTLLKNPVSVTATSTSVSLSVAGIAAAPTAGAGAQPSNTLTVAGTTGQETTGSGQAAGAGADVSIVAGAGGAAPTGSTRGTGGSVTINPGPPGTGAGTAGAYGKLLLATAGGNVGIGTTAPGAKLDVRQTTAADAPVSTAFTVLTVKQPPAGGATYTAFTGQAFNFESVSNSSINLVGVKGIAQNITSKNLATLRGVHGLANVNGTGDTTNAYGVYGESIQQTGTLLHNGYGVYGVAQGAAIANIGGYFTASGGSSNYALITGSGNVGIGTTTPGSKLHVNGGVQVGAPAGGDKGIGSINVSGDIYRNGTPLLQNLEEAYRTILELTQRVGRLEATLAGSSGKEKA